MGIQHLFTRCIIAIFMTLLTGCSELPFLKDSAESDPVAKAAMQVRNSNVGAQHGSTPNSTGPAYKVSPADLSQAVQKGIFQGELVPGMTSNEVAEAWGKPHEIQTAGDPRIRNEKWIYTDRPTQNGSIHPVKVVYFDEGRVSGWETSFQVSRP